MARPPAWHHDPRVAVFEEQFEDLCTGLDWFLDAIRSGEVGFKLYRQYKSDGQRGTAICSNHSWQTRHPGEQTMRLVSA